MSQHLDLPASLIPEGIRTMYVSACPACGVLFGITGEYEARRREDKASFYCPNGHTMSWHESEADRLRKELERTERNLASWREDYAAEVKAHSATKGQLTKVRNRIQRGVCPQCQRHFVNVERHMQTKHAEVQP